ncbi:MAG: hypothetical protein M0C28_16130 [Candidatus Moduliflexus flocculans]|nr:hypothetical protein [Candidatus Moduliflexus flocculans]
MKAVRDARRPHRPPRAVLDGLRPLLQRPRSSATWRWRRPRPGFSGTSTARRRCRASSGSARPTRGHCAKLLYAFFVLKLISRRDVTSRTSVKKIQWSTSGGGYTPPS